MSKQEFDRLYRLYRSYRAFNDNDFEHFNDATLRLVNGARNDAFAEIVKAGGISLNYKFFKMNDAWTLPYDRYKNYNWLVRAYQRKHGTIDQKGWDKIQAWKEWMSSYKSRLFWASVGDIPY